MGLNHELIKAQNGQPVHASKDEVCRLDTHFLFNSLSGLHGLSLSSDNPNYKGEVSDMVLRLSDYLRYVLTSGNEEVTLSQELDFIRTYLDLEKVKYAEYRALSISVTGSDSFVYFPKTILYIVSSKCMAYGPSGMEQPSKFELNAHVQGQTVTAQFEFSWPDSAEEGEIQKLLGELNEVLKSYPIEKYSLVHLPAPNVCKLILKF